jgi:hypothetical protein
MYASRSPLQENTMADDEKSSAKDEQAQDRDQAGAPIKDLAGLEVSKDGAEQVKGGKKMNWDIPAGTVGPSA